MFLSNVLEKIHLYDVPISVKLFCSSTVLLRLSLKFFHLASQDIEIRMQDSNQNRALLERIPSLFEYNPSRLYALDTVGHQQTALQTFIKDISARIFSSVQYDRELLKLPDGGTVALDWVHICKHFKDNAPTVVMMHGLCGSSSSEYLIHVVEVLISNGFRVAVMVARGCGGLDLTTSTPFSAERTSDFNAAINLVHARYPQSSLFAMGFSLGGCLTIKYMADYAESTPVEGALAVSPPWDFTYRYSYTFQFFWTFLLATILKGWSLPHMWQFGRKYFKILFAPTMYTFDDMIAPMHGFNGVDDYYVAASPARIMHRVVRPTLVLSAQDDPVCNINACPKDISRFGPGLIAAIVQHGGHLSFAEKFFSYRCSWIDRVSVEYFNALLNKKRITEENNEFSDLS